jgi:hypothetical protein
MGKLGKTLKVTEYFFVPEMALPSGFDIILGLPCFQRWRPLFKWESPISTTISTSHGTIQLVNSCPVDVVILESEGREGREQLLASILQLRQAQRLGDELMVVHVHPTTTPIL